MDVATFQIKATPLGGRFEVNGRDVTDQVAAAELRITPGQPTTLVLYAMSEGTIEGEGIVQVASTSDDAAELICGFLESIDPDQLDNDSLNDNDAGSNLTAAMLATLQRYARGESCPALT